MIFTMNKNYMCPRPSLHRLVNSQPMPIKPNIINDHEEKFHKPMHKKRANQIENDYKYPTVLYLIFFFLCL